MDKTIAVIKAILARGKNQAMDQVLSELRLLLRELETPPALGVSVSDAVKSKEQIGGY